MKKLSRVVLLFFVLTGQGRSETTPPGTKPAASPATAALPYTTGFEVTEGVAEGALNGQKGWTADRGVVVNHGKVGGAGNYVLLPANHKPLQAILNFPASDQPKNVNIDFFSQGSAAPTVEHSSLYRTDTAQVALLKKAGKGKLFVFNGNGSGGGKWQPTDASLSLDVTNKTASWFELTILEDFSTKTWSLSLNGNQIAKNLGLGDNTITSLGYFSVSGGTAADTLLDGFSAGFDDSTFPDYGQLIMPATITPPANLRATAVTDSRVALTWSAAAGAYGIAGYNVYRNGEPIAHVTGTSCTDNTVGGDMDISYEVEAYDGVGNLSARNAPIAIHTPKTLDKANGLPVEWEQHYYDRTGLDPQAPSGNGDGYSILQEYKLGRDPTDFYNGVVPIHKPLYDGHEGPDGQLAMIVVHPDGTPWPNAPITFNVTTGHRRFSATKGGPVFQLTVQVRADANGLAQVYLEPLTP